MARILKSGIWIIIAALLLAPALSCDDESPGDVVLVALQAYNDRDFNKLYDLSSASLREQLGDREQGIEIMAGTWPPGASISDIEILEENIDGDTAEVVWRGNVQMPDLPVRDTQSTIKLVREEDQWKLDSNSS